jgi:cysteine synthase B
VQIRNIFKNDKVKIFAKLEGQNPGGSVKDRAAYNMIKEAIKRGELPPGTKLI